MVVARCGPLFRDASCKVMWPISSSLEQLQTHVDTATFSLGILKSLATAAQTACQQWAPWLIVVIDMLSNLKLPSRPCPYQTMPCLQNVEQRGQGRV